MILNLDKSTWQRVKFGEVVKNANTKSTDPDSDGIDRVIAMEHIDPGELAINRWGPLDAGTSFTRRVFPGQTLFGKRRAYQRKVAYAEFDAICSGDILTFEAIPGKLRPELLPFIAQSEPFFERAVGTSAGSLSPRTNWRDLAKFEFDLPPLDEQKRIADLLWAVERHVQALQRTLSSVWAARSRYLDIWISRLPASAFVDLSNLWSKPPESGWSQKPVDNETGHFVLSLSALGDHGYSPGRLKPVDTNEKVAATRLSRGDLLISRANTNKLVGRAGIFAEDRSDISFPDTMMRLHVDDTIGSEFCVEILNSAHGRSYMRRVAAGSATSMVKINRKTLGKFPFPNIGVDRQASLIDDLSGFDSSIEKAREEVSATSLVRSSFLCSIFGDS